MICRACKFEHPPMQDCKVAARIRSGSVTAETQLNVTQTPVVTAKQETSVTRPVSVTAFLHPNVTVFADLSADQVKWPRTAAQRMREYRERNATRRGG